MGLADKYQKQIQQQVLVACAVKNFCVLRNTETSTYENFSYIAPLIMCSLTLA